MDKKEKIVVNCKLCLMTNQKPFSVNETKNDLSNQKKNTLPFNNQGVCSACENIKSKKNIDWSQREKELVKGSLPTRDGCDTTGLLASFAWSAWSARSIA